MDGDFLAAFKALAFHPSASRSPFLSLGKVLAQSSSITSLRIRVAESSGADSAWSRTNLVRIDGIPISKALKRTLPASLRLKNLKNIELDGFSAIAPLLRIAPNLESLSVSQPSGFAQCTNEEFVDALSFVPRLRELVYTPESLRVTSTINDIQAAMEIDDEDESRVEVPVKEVDYSAELVREIGTVLPQLESLSLQVRWHGEEMVFPASEEPITQQALLEAGEHLPNLKHLSLPSSLFSAKDYAVLRSSAPSSDAVLEGISTIERSTAFSLAHTCQQLESISFIRPISTEADNKHDVCVSYPIHIVPEHVIYLGRNSTPIVRPIRVEVAPTPIIADAAAGQFDSLPSSELVRPSQFHEKWTQAVRSMTRMSQHPMAGVVGAVGAGIVLGEAGRVFYSHVIVA